MKNSILILIAAVLFSCEKKELPVKPYIRGDINTTQVVMGSDYRNQIWYSLDDNQVVSTNLKTAWDLAFETSASGYHIFLNGSKSMKLLKTSFAELSEVKNKGTVDADGIADMPSGNMDSTAIGNWQADNKVYIINRGYDESGFHQGYYKLKLKSVSSTQFTFEYGDIDGTEIRQGSVTKNSDYNFVMYSLSDHAEKHIEPRKTEYDLCFTQYTHLFLDPYQYYLVTGALSNNYKTRIGISSKTDFSSITIADTSTCKFSTKRDAIGYDWKSFDLNTNIYSVKTKLCFIIQDSKGFYYKLHFIDFVNTSGEKGYPKFEFRKL